MCSECAVKCVSNVHRNVLRKFTSLANNVKKKYLNWITQIRDTENMPKLTEKVEKRIKKEKI